MRLGRRDQAGDLYPSISEEVFPLSWACAITRSWGSITLPSLGTQIIPLLSFADDVVFYLSPISPAIEPSLKITDIRKWRPSEDRYI